jgi:uncharacterized protein
MAGLTLTVLLFFCVLIVSLVLTMVGLGGGLVFSPLFVLLGMPQADAASASLLLNMIAAASAAMTYYRRKMVDFSIALPLLVASGLAAPLGSLLNTRLSMLPFLLTMAVVLLLAAVRMLLPPVVGDEKRPVASWEKWSGGLLIGAVIGLVGGLLGIGGGVFIVPLLIYILKIPTKTAAGTSIFVVCFSSFTGFLGYASLATLNWQILFPAAIASFVGGLAGSRLMSNRLSGAGIRWIFSAVLLGLSISLLYRAVVG